MFGGIHESITRFLRSWRSEAEGSARRKEPAHNLFEAAAVYVSACAEDDQDRMDEAVAWVSPEALSFGVNELACRAVIALARERDESPRTVARELLGLPTT
ncbi:hypothetical protein ACOT81_03180 [Streptomyces sp. WI04-05B]|uniref:hypothetical protein n=1 Tax=Streptomyces TaxID=1883 RepID=UPI0029B4B282|nr:MULTISPECIES: hypothetical protein [unclassified Streptomyces]MDX2548019.1 hypothetical protein [Streptomyces sp. WI04-05B]MDX2583358.1 hypothetical protein [Streptomyces sp. WI04-05A]MDX3745126.1 hypothetical protein [Streptomyces sp. AK08-02]